MEFKNTAEFANQMDQEDKLSVFKDKFYIPEINNKKSLYFCGNSLGLQAKTTAHYIEEELKSWQSLAVEAHFKAERPWLSYHQQFKAPLSRLVGSLPEEVVAMNSLTTNLHLMMVSFYRPTTKRYKIITEGGAFPSDMYSLESQVLFHKLDPEEAIIELHPRQGEHTLRTEDIIQSIEANKDEVALVLMGGVQYYTGQFFDLKEITKVAHKVGALAGFDLAHAIGNVPLQLHDWEVDFAVWCSYKYLNGSPGGTGGAFVHSKHASDKSLPRFAGWWGHIETERFKMEKGFKPIPGADGWQLSNAPILSMAALKASLEIFDMAGFTALRKKSIALTGYLQYLIMLSANNSGIKIITPTDPDARGCQLSLIIPEGGRDLFKILTANGIIADWREPDVIRISPVPLYNSFSEVFLFGSILNKALNFTT